MFLLFLFLLFFFFFFFHIPSNPVKVVRTRRQLSELNTYTLFVTPSTSALALAVGEVVGGVKVVGEVVEGVKVVGEDFMLLMTFSKRCKASSLAVEYALPKFFQSSSSLNLSVLFLSSILSLLSNWQKRHMMFVICSTDSWGALKRLSTTKMPLLSESSSLLLMKLANPVRLDVTDGTPSTVHSAGV